jgi:hypothetical protein
MLRLRAAAWPCIAAPIPNGPFIPTHNAAEKAVVARIVHRMKSDGLLLPGAADLAIVWPAGGAFVELKRSTLRDLFGQKPAGKPTEAQEAFAEKCHALGIRHAYCSSWDELKAKLDEWGIGGPRRQGS